MKLKSTLSLIAMMFTFALSVVSCTETETPDTSGLVLIPSDTEVVVGQNSEITFTAKFNGQDVTNDATLEIWHIEENENIVLVKNNTFEIKESGKYRFYAYCSNGGKIVESEIVFVNAVEDKTLYLTPSFAAMETGQDVEFEAYIGKNKISPSASNLKLFLTDGTNNTELGSMSYSIAEAKEYFFYATYLFNNEEIRSKTQSVLGLDWNDPQFAKRTLSLQFTASWCKWCPGFTAAIKDYTAEYGDSRSLFASVHSGDIMQNFSSNQLIMNMNIQSFPTLKVGSFDMTKAAEVGLYGGDYTLSTKEMSDAIDKFLATDAKCGIRLSSTIEDDGIAISADVLVGEDGKYGVGAIVLEDGIKAKQTKDPALDYIDFGDYDINIHKNVLQGIYPRDKKLYVDLGGISEQSARYGYRFEHTMLYTDMKSLQEKENCSVVVYVYNTETKVIDNVVKAKVGEKVDYEYKK